MNHSLRRSIIRYKWLLLIINKLYCIFNKSSFEKIIEQRRLMSIFDYNSLAEDIPYSPKDIVIDNNLYGLSYCLKAYSGVDADKRLDATIEHGVFFGSLVREDDLLYPVKSIITYGNRRVTHLKDGNINKNIIPIGPYIHYAQPLLSIDDFNKLKKELGRVLLVFPSHGIIGVGADFNNDSFIKEIERIKSDYDTVLVSIYWSDMKNKTFVSQYKNLGYRIVTSGHRFDLNFLSRQRSIIELADYTISNSLGTHVGYCIYLNKPHYIFTQKILHVSKNKKVRKHFESSRNEQQYRSYMEESEEVMSFFNSDSSVITAQQRVVVDEIWGTSLVRMPDELKLLLQ